MSAPRFVVGIDLGTTHCAIASADLSRPKVRLLQIPQLVAPGELTTQPLLPSFTYLCANAELPEEHRALPWGAPQHIVGELARRMGAKIPNRLVASAKSWVCHGGVNRRAPILPWSAPTEAEHISPFEAQVGYLAHLRATWDATHPDAPLPDQDVIVTVPASFDEGARELTTAAASAAGLGDVRLIEEPQAAFYDFLGAHDHDLEEQLGDAKLILVVDVGGGTTDLTLLVARAGGATPEIERIAVGGHLMLGGDNMDAALAMHALQTAGLERPTDASVWSGLVQSARQTKERLLAHDAPEEAIISMAGRGSKLVASAKSIPVARDDAHRVLLDGFLPRTGATETADRAARAGLTTLGLPYTQDTAIGRHICSFLRRHAKSAEEAGATVVDGLPRPDRLLLNGGVFNAPSMIERLGEVVAGWFGETIPLLDHTSLETAVAFGAVRSGLARRGIGELIGGGTARAYFIGVEGHDGPKALCVAPRGMEDATSVDVPDRVFDLVLGQPVTFALFAYTGDASDAAGALLDLSAAREELDPLPALETVLRNKGAAAAETTPVTLRATMTDAGALELYLSTLDLPPRRWKLDFVLATTQEATKTSSSLPEDDGRPAPELPDATSLIAAAMVGGDPKAAARLRRDIEKVLGPRGQWSAATCRGLWESCIEHAQGRSRSELAELHWLRLCGWTLRPGFGADEDNRRRDTMWSLRDTGLFHPTKANWSEWWVLWRRIAPGMSAGRQQALFEDVAPYLWRGSEPASAERPPKHGPVEMLQLLGSLECMSSEDKTRAGELMFERAKKLGSYWPLGRVGARGLLHPEATAFVSVERASQWLERLLALDWEKTEGADFAAAQIARLTGDEQRNVGRKLRDQVVAKLKKAKAAGSLIEMVTRPNDLSDADMRRIFGESLPTGLRLT